MIRTSMCFESVSIEQFGGHLQLSLDPLKLMRSSSEYASTYICQGVNAHLAHVSTMCATGCSAFEWARCWDVIITGQIHHTHCVWRHSGFEKCLSEHVSNELRKLYAWRCSKASPCVAGTPILNSESCMVVSLLLASCFGWAFWSELFSQCEAVCCAVLLCSVCCYVVGCHAGLRSCRVLSCVVVP